jgi:hypothetical protein
LIAATFMTAPCCFACALSDAGEVVASATTAVARHAAVESDRVYPIRIERTLELTIKEH